ncbi:hypothetical protein [Dyadobacter sp. CY323]|uniref:hypothetical protein n=1 Tax=Dyadobacter sp. CY323 TaxID=2907302 RepID=UPI001F3D3ACB|nr:hypothetical protein [Dyadobacter sp. CY323]MCE6988366.1 hypothetical protein [Dyadobacter sp. CY323]
MRIFTTVLVLLICLSQSSICQVANVQTSSAKTPAYPISLYKSATSMSQNLYNGRQYYVYDARQEEHQFFNQRKWHNGVVMYDGQRFDSIAMLYDIFHDELVIKHFNGDHILLQSEKVDYFLLDQHHFGHFESGKSINEQMRTGFYDVIYNGKSKTLVRRSKQRQEKIVDKRVIALFPQKDFYYIFKDGRYHSVRSKKSTFALFPEDKKELRRVLRDEKIRYRKNRELAIVKIVEAYDKQAQP